MGFSANYKARAWMVTVQEKNCINLEIKEYEDPEGTIRIDVLSFINDFVAHGLIKEVE